MDKSISRTCANASRESECETAFSQHPKDFVRVHWSWKVSQEVNCGPAARHRYVQGQLGVAVSELAKEDAKSSAEEGVLLLVSRSRRGRSSQLPYLKVDRVEIPCDHAQQVSRAAGPKPLHGHTTAISSIRRTAERFPFLHADRGRGAARTCSCTCQFHVCPAPG